MRIVTGDECGLIKEVIPEYTRKSYADISPPDSGVRRLTTTVSSSFDPNEQTRTKGIISLSLISHNNDADDDDDDDDLPSLSFAALRIDGSLEVWNGYSNTTLGTKNTSNHPEMNYKRSQTLSNLFDSENNDESSLPFFKPIGMQLFQKHKLACCDSIGNISIVSCSNDDFHKPKIVNQYRHSKKGPVIKGKKIEADLDKNNSNQNSSVYSTFAVSDSGRAAIAGRDRETVVMDVSTGKHIWKAKNTPPDPQTLLQEPIWSTSIHFLNNDSIPSHSNGSSAVHDDLLVTGTAYKQVKVYDIRSQRRPILSSPSFFKYKSSSQTQILHHRITALCQINSNQIMVGDTAGYMHIMDLRKLTNKSAVGRFVGPCGSIRKIIRHPTLPIVACVGLDRMLRTYQISNRKSLDIVYLKQRLSSCFFCLDGGFEVRSGGNKNTKDMEGITTPLDGTQWNDALDMEDKIQDYVDSDEEEDIDEDDKDEANNDGNNNISSDSSNLNISDSDESVEDEEEDDDDDDDESVESQNEVDDEHEDGLEAEQPIVYKRRKTR